MRKGKKLTEKEKIEQERLRQEKVEEEFKEEEKDRKRYVFFILIFLLLLFLSTFGITVSFYKGGSKEGQEIETDPLKDDNIIFTYSDVDRGGNGINISNAIPISDSQGKALIGKGEYFDFSVTATSKKSMLLYKILVRKDSASTLDNSELKIYLTTLSGSYETELVLTTFSSLKRERINGVDYYVLYEKILNGGIQNYSDFYRLRMWVKNDSNNYMDKTFMLKVDVTAEQVGD